MSKKKPTFTAKEELSIFEETSNTKNTDNTKNTKNTKGRPTTTESTPQPDDYRFNARFTALQGKYLRERAWHLKKSVTAALQIIIEEDMEKHPEVVKTIDDLNE